MKTIITFFVFALIFGVSSAILTDFGILTNTVNFLKASCLVSTICAIGAAVWQAL